MRSDSERSYSREYEYKTGAGRNPGAIILMVLFIIGIIAVLIYTYIIKKTEYSSWETVQSSSNIPNAECIRAKCGYILFNSDGAEGRDDNGTVIWKISYDLKQPIVSTCGDYAVFADRGAQVLHITDGSSSNFVINVSDPIEEVSISEKGVVAVRTDNTDSDHIYLYNVSGDMLLDIKTEVRKSGFPVTMALSPDGYKLVTSYVQASQTQSAWITFYNFDEVGQNYSDKIVGSYSFENSLIPEIRFIGNDRVLTAGENICTLYKFREIPEEIASYTSDGGFISVAADNNGFVLAQQQSKGINLISVYDKDGNNSITIETGMDYDSLSVGTDELILTSEDAYVIYRKNGKEKMRSRMNGTIKLMYASGADATYTVVETSSTEVIRLKTKSEENQGLSDSEK